MKVAFVVPTNRPAGFAAFRRAWEPVIAGHTLIVVEGAPSRTFDAGTDHHYALADIDADLGADSWVISRHDSARRSYGFLVAYRLGAEVIVTLDDDTRPAPGEDFVGGHLAALDASPRWVSSVPGLRVRGLPYGDPGSLPGVVLNAGLWRGVPDLDAACQLAGGTPTDFLPPPGSRVLARGQYAPICGMNLAFRRAFTPLAYFGLQGAPWPFARFDDIWFGVVAKRVCDHLGWSVAVGTPHVRHDRASCPFANLVKEAPGVGFNESFWRLIDAAPLTASDAAGCMDEVGRYLEGRPGEYVATLGRAMRVWASLF